ncbi:MAG: AcrR family transcriptional regulator [Candidatus Azotimanducaceae bacterium]|jgi:AcrR family transcriptional regulator
MTEARRKRGDVTRELLMRAAELLIAQDGIENVTVRAIVLEAGQKNESALQYHFQNRSGLLDAIHQQRNAEVRTHRETLLQPYLKGQIPDLLDICELMVMPSYTLAREDKGFRYYVRGFGPRIAQSSRPIQVVFDNASSEGVTFLLDNLHREVGEIPEALFLARLESTLRFVALSMSHQAGPSRGFAGDQGDRFVSNLQDTMVGILSAPVSAETAKLYSEDIRY